MSGKARMALAVAAGYYLGRRHKLKLAAGLAVAGALGGLSRKGGLLKQGAKILGSSPELEKITGQLRSDLTEVGKAAAVAATGRQLDSLTSKLHDRAEALRRPGEAVGKVRKAAVRAEAEEEPVGEEYDEYTEEDYEEEPRRERSGAGRSQSATRSGR
ncbi:hypothetical protein [Sinosporangium siamense]|uniref:Uncharacterized protein n=1 Tax=Sinosporangium siamense TaxID=1367973 RepID=A0A919RFD8_9ACTN|nr:hypothetical protein [Sinosporangium siamense]GII92878.1 hypothetical protein Ssi02_31090 [Sinosporangium siamense]